MLKRWVKSIFKFFYAGASYRVAWSLRIILFCKQRSSLKLAKYFSNRLQKKYGVFISATSDFDETLILRHPTGVVIGEGVTIGSNVTIYQNVTIGGARLGDGKLNNYPTIGDGTTVFAGAVIIGKISIGSNCIIGANSVVTKDVADNKIVAGVPAKVIGTNQND